VINYRTSIEEYEINGRKVFVKREDLACPFPGPPFAKVRGLLPRLQSLKEKGVKTVGYMETSISMAGWGISYFCRNLEMRSVIFYPKYRQGLKDNQEFQLEKWTEFGALCLPLEKPNRLAINFYRAQRRLREFDRDGVMLPQGLPFQETIDEVAKETENIPDVKTIVSCIGSGAMAAGVIKGLQKRKKFIVYYGILVSPKDNIRMRNKILKMADAVDDLFETNPIKLYIIDAGYEYTDKETEDCPFPCNPWYDRKAFRWMKNNIEKLPDPILFWNIGA